VSVKRSSITYQPGCSVLHRIHPLVKGAWLLVGTVFVFVVHSPWVVLAVLALALFAFLIACLSLGGVRGIRLFVTTILVLAALQILFVRTGVVLLDLGPLVVTTGGVEGAVYVAGRFLSVVLLSYLFVLTTDPNDLAYGLMKAGVPYRYGFALITALRLVPVFEQEGQIVYRAQLARGVRYDTRSLGRFLTLARQFFLPLLISALGKVDALAVSMEGRCFGKYPSRTFLKEVHFTHRDVLALGLLILAVGAIVMSLLAS
jgi:energy-coupling factor transport system permease protein